MRNLYGKHIFVTGASSGIGEAVARAFAENGCQVTGVSRHIPEKTIDFPGGGRLTTRPLDVTDAVAVTSFVRGVEGVDIAVLCAGMGVAGPAETTPMELTRQQMEVNYFGTLNAAQPCLAQMRQQGRGLLVVIGSIAGRVSIPMQSQYSASKYALEAFTDAVRMEMRPFGVRAVIVEPGDTRTGFTDARRTHTPDTQAGAEASDARRTHGPEAESASGAANTPADAAFDPYGDLVTRSVAKMAKDEQNGRSPESVAKAVLRLAGRSDPPARVPVGAEYKALMFLLRLLPDRVRELVLTKLYLPKGV